MALNPPNDAPVGIVDANVVIAICCREAEKFASAMAAVTRLHASGWVLYAPHVLVSEVLYVLCGKLQNGDLTPAEHREALAGFDTLLPGLHFLPSGDAAVAVRAEQLRGGYGCSHSADGLYLALTELLAGTTAATLVTFDAGLKRQATIVAPHLNVQLLEP